MNNFLIIFSFLTLAVVTQAHPSYRIARDLRGIVVLFHFLLKNSIYVFFSSFHAYGKFSLPHTKELGICYIRIFFDEKNISLRPF